MRRDHGPVQEQWKCATCARVFSTKQGAGIHYASAHPRANDGPGVGRPTGGEENDEEESLACSLCDRRLPSQQGLRNHERRWHQAEVCTSLAIQPDRPTQRVRWTEEEIKKFKEGIFSRGISSNKSIAEMVTTKTAR